MGLYNYYYQKSERFFEELKKIKINASLIKEFKQNEIGLNPFSDDYITNVLNKLIELSNYESNEELKAYLREIDLINALYIDYYHSDINKCIMKYIKKKSIGGFLALSNQIAFRVNMLKNLSTSTPLKGDEFKLLAGAEDLLINNSNIIKYYMYSNKIKFNEKMKINEKVRINKGIFTKLLLSSFWMSTFDIIIGMWKLNCLNIFIKNNTLFFKIKNVDVLKESDVCERIYLSQQEALGIKAMNYEKFEPNTQYKNFIIKQEYSSYNDLVNIFYNECLDEKMKGVEYSTWLRAISLIIRKVYSIRRNIFNPVKIFIRKEKFWIDYLCEESIKKEDAKIIIDELKFSNKSMDYFDSPFIHTKKGLAILPECTKLINPSRAIESIMIRTKSNNQEKGKYFEKYVYRLLERENIQFININSKLKGEEFQCDLIFLYMNEVFFCELKNDLFPRTYKKYFKNQEILKNHIKQINRLYCFHRNNSDIEIMFRKKYREKSNYSKKSKQYKMIIYSHIIGKTSVLENTIITDIINFKDFLTLKQYYNSLTFRCIILMNTRYKILTKEDEIEKLSLKINFGKKFNRIEGEVLKRGNQFIFNEDEDLIYQLEKLEKIQKKCFFLIDNCNAISVKYKKKD